MGSELKLFCDRCGSDIKLLEGYQAKIQFHGGFRYDDYGYCKSCAKEIDDFVKQFNQKQPEKKSRWFRK